jgi:hypothetical protein
VSVFMTLVLGLFGDPSGLVDKHYVRIVDPAELPDMTRWGPPGPDGSKSSLFRAAKYGWHPGRGDVRGNGRVAAVIHRLGPPMEFIRIGRTEHGYIWRHRRPDRPHAGIMIIVDERAGTVQLRDWHLVDLASRYGGRLDDMGKENEIYRWFEWITTPLTPAEALSPPAMAPGGVIQR